MPPHRQAGRRCSHGRRSGRRPCRRWSSVLLMIINRSRCSPFWLAAWHQRSRLALLSWRPARARAEAARAAAAAVRRAAAVRGGAVCVMGYAERHRLASRLRRCWASSAARGAPLPAALAPRGATRRRRAVVEQAAAAAPQLQAHHGFAGSRQQLGVGGRGRRVGRELWVRAWRAECVDGAATRAVEAANRAVQAAPNAEAAVRDYFAARKQLRLLAVSVALPKRCAPAALPTARPRAARKLGKRLAAPTDTAIGGTFIACSSVLRHGP